MNSELNSELRQPESPCSVLPSGGGPFPAEHPWQMLSCVCLKGRFCLAGFADNPRNEKSLSLIA